MATFHSFEGLDALIFFALFNRRFKAQFSILERYPYIYTLKPLESILEGFWQTGTAQTAHTPHV